MNTKNAYAYASNNYFPLAFMHPCDFLAIAKRKIIGVPIIYTIHGGASYFWPKKDKQCEIVWL